MENNKPVVTLTALAGIPQIRPGDALATLLGDALTVNDLTPRDQDVLVISQKIVSKAENRYVSLGNIVPSPDAQRLALHSGKDPALVEVILSESNSVLRVRPGLIITEHRLGMVMANAGIDQSNIASDRTDSEVLLLPINPDGSSAALRDVLNRRFAVDLAVIIIDSAGRAWRQGVIGLALGAAGLPTLLDLRGKTDLAGRPLTVTQSGFADQIASAAQLVMGEAAEGQPAVLVQGLSWQASAGSALDLIRPAEEDLFR